MSTSWDGLALQTEFSEEAGDTSTTFKARISAWTNDIQNDISGRFDWPNLTKKGKKSLTASVEEHSLVYSVPGAATVAIAAGGSLTEDSLYKVIVTFVDSNGLETKAGTESAAVTATAANKTISVSAIPTSSETLVNKRRIYVANSTDSGATYSAFFLSTTISDNTTTTATITSEPSTSDREPPDYDMIYKLAGNPFFEATFNVQLEFKPIDQMRRLVQSAFGDGSPSLWSSLGGDKILMYPRPSSSTDLSYYYQKRPDRIYPIATSFPEIVPELKPVLRAGVIHRVYEFRDRDGQESKRNNYEELLNFYISRYGETTNANASVIDVMGDSDGFEIG